MGLNNNLSESSESSTISRVRIEDSKRQRVTAIEQHTNSSKESTIRDLNQQIHTTTKLNHTRHTMRAQPNHHQAKGKIINKLALVLLSIVILELVLIGDQVQPVKAIKKKIFLKKLKKMLPLLALIKPKKKIILLPVSCCHSIHNDTYQ